MVDDKEEYNDEYQFADLDVISPDSLDGEEEFSATASPMKQQPEGRGKKDIRRNALIVVGVVIIAMILYKFLGSSFTKTTNSDIVPAPPLTITTPPPVAQPPVTTATVQPVVPQPTRTEQSSPDNSQVTQKLSMLESGQENLRSDLNVVNNQLNGMSNNVNELTAKIADLSQMLTTLAAKVDQQSNQIALLTTRAAPKPAPRIVHRGLPRAVYYIQAVIPGRAWLIATNGSTLTVREGTQIAGYGLVKLIDARQGRIVTSSGQVIRFSQQDS